jgi:hypothetical protein
MQQIADLLKNLCEKKFTGSVQINFSNGGIANINCNSTARLNEAVQTTVIVITV